MKNRLFLNFCILLFSTTSIFAQDIVGTWSGAIQGMPLVFEISASDAGYSAQMQSPKQSKAYLAMDEATFEGDVLTLKLTQFQIVYEGQFIDGTILGTFTQGGASFPMNLEKKGFDESDLRKKQEPVAPFPYQVEEVEFVNESAGGIKLAGTLTRPPSIVNPPVAILISGSGPQDRNEEIMNHKPFLVIADHLTKNGIAVLRYDDRGVKKSEGDFASATSANFATDVAAAIKYLNTRDDINKESIGLIGHSEGGLIAPMVIAQHPDKVAFFISLAGTGVRGDKVLLPQMKRLAEFSGSSDEDVVWEEKLMGDLFKEINAYPSLSNEELNKKLLENLSKSSENATPSQLAKYPQEAQAAIAEQFSNNWMRYFLTHDPTADLKKVKIPTLLLNGSLDYQVMPSINLPAMEKNIKSNGNKDVTVMKLDGLNHLFQTAVTGSGSEYGTLEETFAPVALDAMTEWIKKRF
jgi:hypothetical protein